MLRHARGELGQSSTRRPKFTPEQQEKIHAEALRRYREKAMAAVDLKGVAKDETPVRSNAITQSLGSGSLLHWKHG